tara:strand:+ start:357 stop:1247 length:891 start_codon:yes stop_codon:yes gene_type:complete
MPAPQYPTCKISDPVGRSCKNKQGGIAKLYLFSYVKYSKSLNLVQGQKVITFPLSTAYLYEAENISFTESTSVKDGGVEWTQRLSFTVVGTSLSSEVYKLPNKDYSAVILDRNGNYRFIGMRNGGEVSVSAASGVNKNELNGYSISLEAKEDNQAYYVPTFESLFNVIVPIGFILPSVPTNLTNNQYTGGDTISLYWDDSTPGTLALQGYYFYVNNEYYSAVNIPYAPDPGDGTSITIPNLEPNTYYSLYVRAYDVDGNYSGKSNEVNFTTVGGGAYELRVANDLGYTESLSCIKI